MKRYKSYILFGMFALSFAGCNTDDLEQNIDTLTSRVESMETQVQALNNNMNVIRVLLDGNKTIQSYTYDEATQTYTLLLSDGQTLTLTQGNTDGVTYPVIEISDDGYWVIDGVKSDQRAKAEDGQAATVTPQFRIEEDGGTKYWQVSYDEGASWEYVKDESGNNVVADGTPGGTNPIKDVTREGDNLKIMLSDDETYTIPIVEGLVCEIAEPEGMENGIWHVSGAQSFSVTVSEDGATVRVVAPAEWGASISGTGAERTVSVTAPLTPSECKLSVEVTKGVYTAADEITVRTDVGAGGYYADFMAGLDIQIGNVKINKKMFSEGVTIEHVTTTDKEISGGGVYFINESASVKLVKTGSSSSLQLDGDLVLLSNGETQAKVTSSVGTVLNGASLYCKNIEFDAQNINPCIQVQTANAPVVAFDKCKIIIPEASSVKYPSFLRSNTAYGIDNVYIYNSVFVDNRQTAAELRFINLDHNASPYNETKFGNVEIKNNLFYSTVDGGHTTFGLVYVQNNNNTNIGITNLTLQNNTFANVSKGGMIYGDVSTINMSKNIFCPTGAVAIFRRRGNVSSGTGLVTQDMQGIIKDNIGYGTSFNIVYGGASPIPAGVDGEQITALDENPYSTYEPGTGNFVLNLLYADYGYQGE